MRSAVLRLARAVGRVCALVIDVLDTDLRLETPADGEVVRRVAAEAEADRLRRELHDARRELDRVTASLDTIDELREARRRQAN